MNEIYLIRHGLTEANKHSIFQGITDNPLSKIGLNQALQTSEYLYTKKIGKIYSSPLKRTISTAKPLSEKLNLKIEIENCLKEINCGDWEGKSVEKIRKQSNLFYDWIMKGDVKAPNGESIKDLMEKLTTFLSKLLKESLKTDKNIAVFAHGAINRAIICSILNLPPSCAFRFEQKNSCINCFTVREGFPVTINMLNFTDHLSE